VFFIYRFQIGLLELPCGNWIVRLPCGSWIVRAALRQVDC
jgi:hypothetical protein